MMVSLGYFPDIKELENMKEKSSVAKAADSIDAINNVIETLRRDFDWDSHPGYTKRNLIRELYDIARAAGADCQRAVVATCDAIKDVKLDASVKFGKESGK